MHVSASGSSHWLQIYIRTPVSLLPQKPSDYKVFFAYGCLEDLVILRSAYTYMLLILSYRYSDG
jgi:hypothetical protein